MEADRSISSLGSFDSTQFSTDSGMTDFQNYIAEHPKADCIVGVDGCWYDVTNFRHRHPGGPLVLEKCHGKDVTELVKSFHERNVLKGWRPVGRYARSIVLTDPASKAFRALHEEFIQKGYFKTSMSWYARKIAATFAALLCSVALIVSPAVLTTWRAIFAGFCLGLFWQQCGFLMHDLMHSEMTHKRQIDRWVGMFFGSFCLGVSAHWWRDEHFEHHAFTNVVDKETLYVDPQMQEELWSQSPLMFPLYINRGHWAIDWVQTQLLRFQHIFWIPICVFAGRVGIIVNGIFKERRWYEVLSLSAHNIMMGCFIFFFIPTWKLRFLFYATAALYEGVLHMQLLVSHYAKPWTEMKDVATTVDWYRLQVYCNINIQNPIWLDWFHGGLNFHIEHHLYPRMPRNRFRETSARVREVCQEVGIVYDECCFTDALIRTLRHLKEIGALYVEALRKEKIEKDEKKDEKKDD